MELKSLKQKINIKYFMAVYFALAFLYAAIFFGGGPGSFKGLLIVILYPTYDLVWTYIRDKVWYFPLSSIISGFVIGIVSQPNPSYLLIILLPFLAVFSKQLISFGKMRHVFNPAGFAMFVMSFFAPVVTWWATSWDLKMIVVILLISMFILWKQERWHVAISFLLSYIIFLALMLLIKGLDMSQILNAMDGQLINGTVLFFTTVMLIEPLTSSFPEKKHRIIYGLIIGFSANLIALISGYISFGHQNPLILGLLLGNLTASLLFLPRRKQIA